MTDNPSPLFCWLGSSQYIDETVTRLIQSSPEESAICLMVVGAEARAYGKLTPAIAARIATLMAKALTIDKAA